LPRDGSDVETRDLVACQVYSRHANRIDNLWRGVRCLGACCISGCDIGHRWLCSTVTGRAQGTTTVEIKAGDVAFETDGVWTKVG
jgi:hypothetical protein